MDHSIETVFLMAEAKYQSIASKLVKEIASLDGDISKFVTPRVEAELLAKLGKG
jgi:pantetheine-phosphate adenylyltransferase